MKTLSPSKINDFLAANPDWSLEENKLKRNFTFKGFGKAMDFMQEMRTPINALRHHPEWSNTYNKLTVALTTHDAGGITQADIDLAYAFEIQFSKSS